MMYIFSKKKIILLVALFIASVFIGGALHFSSVTAQIGIDIDEIAACMEQVRKQESGGGQDDIPLLFTEDIFLNECNASTRALAKILECDPRTRLGGSDGFCGSGMDIQSPRFGTFMQQSVNTFQLVHSLSVTGVAGSAMRKVLQKLTGGVSTATGVLAGTLGGGFGIGGPFGGMVSFVQPCTCSCGAVVVVGPPRGGPYLYCPGVTQVFEYFQIPRPGVWLLGLSSPPAACLIWAGKICVPAPIQPIGTIIIVGTSL